MYIRIHAYMFMCIYMYIYIYAHTHTCTHTHTHLLTQHAPYCVSRAHMYISVYVHTHTHTCSRSIHRTVSAEPMSCIRGDKATPAISSAPHPRSYSSSSSTSDARQRSCVLRYVYGWMCGCMYMYIDR